MTEPTNVELRNALNRLRANAAGKGAPASLEAALTDAFRAQHARKITPFRKWFWVPAAVAASFVVGVAWRLSAPTVIPDPPRTVASVGAPAPVLRNEPKSAAVRQTVRRKARGKQDTQVRTNTREVRTRGNSAPSAGGLCRDSVRSALQRL